MALLWNSRPHSAQRTISTVVQVVAALFAGVMAAATTSTTARAQVPGPVNVCTGMSINLPTLTDIGGVSSGLGLILDGILNGIVGDVNTNLTSALSGANLGLSILDTNGNALSFPADPCQLATDGLIVNADQGITIGGGQVDGLGGTGNPLASAGEVNSIAIGNNASTTAGALNSVAIGVNAASSATGGVAFGSGASVSATGGVALGAGSIASRAGLGGGTEDFSGTAVASTNGAVSVGNAGGERQITNVAGGTAATDAVNVRQLQAVGGNLATALGGGAAFDSTTGLFTTPTFTVLGSDYSNVAAALAALDGAIGPLSVPLAANNTSALAVPTATGDDSMALGYGASAGAINAVAMGTNASAGFARSVAIGYGAATTRADQVSLGVDTSTYTLPGLGSAASNAAQTGPTSFVTTDADGNLGTANFDPTLITQLSNQIDLMQIESRQGIAMAMAMPSAMMPSAAGKTTWNANVATFKGQLAGGFSLSHRLDLNVPLAINVGVTTAGNKTFGARVGVAGEF